MTFTGGRFGRSFSGLSSLFESTQPEAITPPLRSRFGACQFAVPQASSANSRLNLMIFQNADTYSLAAVEAKRRWEIRSAAKVFTIREITDVNEFKEKAYPSYLSFYQRTEYNYKKERLNQFWFSRWAESLFQFGKFVILGAYRNGQLEGICCSLCVEDTVFYTTAFCTGEALRLNVSSFLLHSVREAVASDRQAKQIFAGMYKYAAARGVDDFYLLRGCSLVQKPAILRINPLAMALLRVFRPKELSKLLGIIPDAPAAANPAKSGKPGQTAKDGQSSDPVAKTREEKP